MNFLNHKNIIYGSGFARHCYYYFGGGFSIGYSLTVFSFTGAFSFLIGGDLLILLWGSLSTLLCKKSNCY